MNGSSIITERSELETEHDCDHGRNFKFRHEWDNGVSPEECGETAVIEVSGPSGRIGGLRLCDAHAAEYEAVTGE